MSTQRENNQITQLTAQQAVTDEKVSTIKETVTALAADFKTMNATIQAFTFVKEQDYQKDQQNTRGRESGRLEERVGTLERNTSVIVRFKNVVGERGTQLLVLVLFALIIFGVYLILKHSNAESIINGSEGQR